MTLFLLLILLALLAWWFFLREPDELVTTLPVANSAPRKSRYRAVRLASSGTVCHAAKNLATKRMLLTQAARLPLEHCDRIALCQCRYKHYKDRRRGDDRRRIFGSAALDMRLGSRNRRSGIDRRKRPPEDSDFTQI